MKEFIKKYKIGVIGLGYVGLPLLDAFSEKYNVVGFDTDKNKIKKIKLRKGRKLKTNTLFTSNENDLIDCNIYIIAVPTPIDRSKNPDLYLLKKATETVGRVLSDNNIVIYESTVFPGTTEKICVPIIEKVSKLKLLTNDNKKNSGFYCGYSPERINPGDSKKTFKKIIKIVSGSSKGSLDIISKLYSSVITAGIYKTKNIITAESAKIIENVQRDLNIALTNELAMLFNKMNLNTSEILKAAGTKWNFQKFTPGLVGGHCIGVDPYYLMFKAQELGFKAKLITQGREINDEMPNYVVSRVKILMKSKNIKIFNSNILILGFTFKENLEDVRNTKVENIYNKFNKLGANVSIYDPIADKQEVKRSYNINMIKKLKKNHFDAVILAVAHKEFKKLTRKKIINICKKNFVIYDVKSFLDERIVDEKL